MDPHWNERHRGDMSDAKRRKTDSSASSFDGSRAPRAGERKNSIWDLAKSKESNDDDEESPKGEAFEPMLTNVNAAFHLGIPVCCKKIALSLRCAEYNPQNKSHGVILKNKTPRCTARILASGKVSLTGARSVEDTKTTAKHITKYISKLGYPEAKCTQFSIEQMHASAVAPFLIRLEHLRIIVSMNPSALLDLCIKCRPPTRCRSGYMQQAKSSLMEEEVGMIYFVGLISFDLSLPRIEASEAKRRR